MGENQVRQAQRDTAHGAAAKRAQQTGGGWATYVLADQFGQQAAVVRVPLDEGVIDVLQMGAGCYLWNERSGQYPRARVYHVTGGDIVENK